MKNRKAMELSINFIVTFILAIVVFGMGIYFANSIMNNSVGLTGDIYTKFDEQIGELACGRGESICMSTSTKDIERGKIDAFSITIKNGLKERTTFRLEVEPSRAYKSDNTDMGIGPSEWNIDSMYDQDEFSLDPDESKTIPILFQPQKKAITGRYSFNAYFYYEDATATSSWPKYPDDKPNKFYVNVK
jgi:hypothetical protein